MIWFLHGMLGTGGDLQWSGREKLERVDLWSQVAAFDDWAHAFCREARAVPPDREPRILVGYSMGGRLALHALLTDPGCWDGAVIISAHPGLEQEREREARLRADREWAALALQSPWNEFMEIWNAQEVFAGGGAAVDRGELEPHRASIALAFDLWSLGRQEQLRGRLSTIRRPLLWITGEGDARFCSLAEELGVARAVAPGSGHRVPMDRPDWLQARIREFSSSIA